ncbi:hypothetical protein XENTR_v10002143 [Xenopus tropicalis]|nr:hypothetical protein XENTR_v10002143 [Xenopus tropicalis]
MQLSGLSAYRNTTSSWSHFTFLAFSSVSGTQNVLFVIFLSIYLVALLGNLTIIFVITSEGRLQSPMYFLLGHLSFLDLCYISVTVPEILSNFMGRRQIITYSGCVVQLLFFISMEGTEALILAVMAYDRYVAICYPLRYSVIMNRGVCFLLVAASWLGGLLNSLVHTILTFSLSFCDTNLKHFFCDIPPLLQASCTQTHVNELVLFVVGGIWVGFSPFIFIIISYTFIICTVIKIPSTEGRHKAFSTCASHLTIVSLFYGTAIFTYIKPSATYSLQTGSLVSLFYSVATPMFNPIIYSLRNQEIKKVIVDWSSRSPPGNCKPTSKQWYPHKF